MELLDIVDENGEPTGEKAERSVVHAQGLRHRTAHVWLIKNLDTAPEILLQKRSDDKDSFPGRYDISSAGHILAGTDFVTSAVRELKEELGVDIAPEQLIYCGQLSDRYETQFYGKTFRDNQVSNVYILLCPDEWTEESFTLQEEEVAKVKWMDLYECMEAVRENRISHCIRVKELEMVERMVSKLKIG